jgi:uncharacterized protein YcfL
MRKRKLLYFILICMAFVCMFILASCNSSTDVALTAPQGLSVDTDTLLLIGFEHGRISDQSKSDRRLARLHRF